MSLPRGSAAELERMAQVFCAQRQIAWREFVGPHRWLAIARARQEFMARAYETGKYSLPTIGRFLNRDHTTVLYGLRAYYARSESNLSPTGQQRAVA